MTEAFKGRKLIVVGGSGGMGRQIAADVVAGGGSAVIIGRRQDRVDETVVALGPRARRGASLLTPRRVARGNEKIQPEHGRDRCRILPTGTRSVAMT